MIDPSFYHISLYYLNDFTQLVDSIRFLLNRSLFYIMMVR